MTAFRCTTVDTLYDANGAVLDTDSYSYGPVAPADVEDLIREWITRWTAFGYAVRSGDTWVTGASPEVTHSVCFDRLTPAEVEDLDRQEAQADRDYDAWKNA